MNLTSIHSPFRLTSIATGWGVTASSFLLFAHAASAQLVFQPTTEATSKDTKIYISTPANYFPSNLNITSSDTGAYFLSLVQFDISSLPLTASQITSASLTLYSTGIGQTGASTSGGTVTLSPILNAWRENDDDAGTAPVATYNAFFTDHTLSFGSAVASQNVTAAGFVTWDITSTVKSWVDGSLANNGLFIQLSTLGGDVGFADVDSNPGIAGSAPKLTIVPEPCTSALFLGATALLGLRRRRPDRPSPF